MRVLNIVTPISLLRHGPSVYQLQQVDEAPHLRAWKRSGLVGRRAAREALGPSARRPHWQPDHSPACALESGVDTGSRARATTSATGRGRSETSTCLIRPVEELQ